MWVDGMVQRIVAILLLGWIIFAVTCWWPEAAIRVMVEVVEIAGLCAIPVCVIGFVVTTLVGRTTRSPRRRW